MFAAQLRSRHTALHLAQHTPYRDIAAQCPAGQRMIWASVNRVFFIGLSSFILPRKFGFRIHLRSGAITGAARSNPIDQGSGIGAVWSSLG